jgi:hypothetical protein
MGKETGNVLLEFLGPHQERRRQEGNEDEGEEEDARYGP